MGLFNNPPRKAPVFTPPPPVRPPELDSSWILEKNWEFRGLAGLRALQQDFFTRYRFSRGALDFINDDWTRARDIHQLSNDGLSLPIRQTSNFFGAGGFETAMVRSKYRFDPSGGPCFLEARFRVSAAPGTGCAFWLTTAGATTTDSDPVYPEIDVFELIQGGLDANAPNYQGPFSAENSKTIYCNLLSASPGSPSHIVEPPGGLLVQKGSLAAYTPSPEVDYADGAWHDAAIRWGPTSCAHVIDHVEVADRPYTWTQDDGQPAPSARFMLTYWAGGNWTGKPLWGEDFPSYFDCQYVSLWRQQ